MRPPTTMRRNAVEDDGTEWMENVPEEKLSDQGASADDEVYDAYATCKEPRKKLKRLQKARQGSIVRSRPLCQRKTDEPQWKGESADEMCGVQPDRTLGGGRCLSVVRDRRAERPWMTRDAAEVLEARGKRKSCKG